jgi:hypothetical protein
VVATKYVMLKICISSNIGTRVASPRCRLANACPLASVVDIATLSLIDMASTTIY